MNTRKQPDSPNKLAILPMWVIGRIKEEMRLGPAAWQAITDAVEQAEVPQALPCEVKLPPGTVLGQGSPLSTLLMAIAQRASQPAHAQVFSSEPEAPQPHPEPIAWMVGTAFWWTKEEAERDAAATGLPMIPVGTMVDASEVERLREENRVLQKQLGERWADIDALNKSNEEYSAAAVDSGMQSDTLRAQLAELEALHGGELGLPKEGWPEYHKREMESLRDLTVGRYERKLAERDALLRELADAPPAAMEFRLQQKVKAALSASAEPSALGILSRAHDVNMFQRAAEPGAKS